MKRRGFIASLVGIAAAPSVLGVFASPVQGLGCKVYPGIATTNKIAVSVVAKKEVRSCWFSGQDIGKMIRLPDTYEYDAMMEAVGEGEYVTGRRYRTTEFEDGTFETVDVTDIISSEFEDHITLNEPVHTYESPDES